MQKQLPTRILIFVEDPGAANYIVPAIDELSKRGVDHRLLAQGNAVHYLIQRGIEFEAIPSNADPDQMIDRWQPGLVAIGTAENVRTWAWKLLESASSKQLVTVGFVDSSVNASFRFRGETNDALAHCPNRLIVPDVMTSRAFEALGVDEQYIQVCGHPNYDRVRAAIDRRARFDHSTNRSTPHTKAVFLSEISDAIGGGLYQRDADYGFEGHIDRPLRTQVVLDEFLKAVSLLDEDFHLTLRLHPKQDPEELQSYIGQFDQVSRGGDPIDSILDADFVVGMTTALLDEAAILEVPTLSVIPRECETSWNASIQWGATATAMNANQLLDQLRVFIETKSFRRSGEVELPPPGAANKVAEEMIRLALVPLADNPVQESNATLQSHEKIRNRSANDEILSIGRAQQFDPSQTRRRQAC